MIDIVFNYLEKQIIVIGKSLEPSIINLDYNNIHNFRVASKKLRDVFGLLDYNKNSYKKLKKLYNKNFKKITNKLGKVRELQIALNFIQDYNNKRDFDLFVFEEFLKNSLNIHHKKLLYNYDSIEKLKDSYNDFLYLLSVKFKKHSKKIERYFLQNLNKRISEHNFPINNHIELHEFRKYLKTIRYGFEVISESNKNLIDDIEKKIHVIRKYEVSLGNWHDNLVILNYLKKCTKTSYENRYYQLLQLNVFIKLLAQEVEELQNKVFHDIYTDSELKSVFFNCNLNS